MADDVVNFENRRWIWGRDIDEPRFLHVALRVKDLDESVRFYRDGLGMTVKDRISIPRVRPPWCSLALTRLTIASVGS